MNRRFTRKTCWSSFIVYSCIPPSISFLCTDNLRHHGSLWRIAGVQNGQVWLFPTRRYHPWNRRRHSCQNWRSYRTVTQTHEGEQSHFTCWSLWFVLVFDFARKGRWTIWNTLEQCGTCWMAPVETETLTKSSVVSFNWWWNRKAETKKLSTC